MTEQRNPMGDPHGSPRAPWDVRRPQPAIQALVEAGGFSGRVLDVGCGYGENALFIAASGLHVTGYDLDREALDWAAEQAAERGLADRIRFLPFDARKLIGLGGGTTYDTVLDSLVFHSYGNAASRARHVAGLGTVLAPGGRLHLLCYSDRHVGPPDPPHTISLAAIREAFADGWAVDEVRETTSISNLAPDGVASWLVTCSRAAGSADFTPNQEES
ncbi:SAM-dependent methyltransferase [Catenulispora sp. EB89]|uniref:SAM-dependent methyltransferase n=1 Tax=Catenulispora sp. EB89 TaxID=3156257 RepID=UPI00351790F2